MTAGPAIKPISSAVIAAITARKVMYWKTRRKPNSGLSDCSHVVRLSSMRFSFLFLFRALHDGLDHAFHLHEARALHEHAAHAVQLAEHRGVERFDVGEVAALHRGRLVAQREELVDAARANMLADLGVELRPLVAHLAHVAEDGEPGPRQFREHVDRGA